MATMTVQANSFAAVAEHPNFSWAQRMVLRRTHPISIILDVIALMWAVFYFWNHNWPLALLILVCDRALSWTFTRHIDLPAMAETGLGKVALLHLHPFNISVQFLGAVVWIVGLWTHSTETILAGLSLVAAGHAFGWEKVNPSLDLHGTREAV